MWIEFRVTNIWHNINIQYIYDIIQLYKIRCNGHILVEVKISFIFSMEKLYHINRSREMNLNLYSICFYKTQVNVISTSFHTYVITLGSVRFSVDLTFTLNWSKVTVKTFILIQKISVSNKICSFEPSIH